MTVLLMACERAPVAPLNVGMNAWVGYDPLVLARDKRYLDPELVKVVELSSSSETLRYFRNGLLDAAALTLDEVLRLADEGLQVRVIAALDTSSGADLVVAEPGIGDLSQLKGATIVLESTTVGALVLQRLLNEARLKPSDVKVLQMEAPQHLIALKSQLANAAVTYEPMAGKLKAAGYRTIFDSRQMPGEIVDVLVVRESTAIEHPEQVDELLKGWANGVEAVQVDPASAAKHLAPGADLSPGDYLTTLQNLTFYTPEQSLALLAGAPPALAQNAERLTLTLLNMGLLKESPDWSVLVDASAAQRSKMQKGQP
jgi:NitT/TauT family transport system substrate-binding protein